MRKGTLCGLAAAAVLALPAQAHFLHGRDSAYRGAAENHTIHTAAANPDDQLLADRVADALRADPALTDTTVTVAVNNGRVNLSGSAKDTQLAYRAERIASAVAGRGNVSGTLDPQGA
jgi:osmotically-inducible protein OsmY